MGHDTASAYYQNLMYAGSTNSLICRFEALPYRGGAMQTSENSPSAHSGE
jgi:hypothetical protein